MQAESVGRSITPRSHRPRALGERAQRLLPLEAIRDLISLEVVAPGEAQELRLHVHQHLHEIGAKAVRLVLEGWWKQRNEAQPDLARAIDSEGVSRAR